MGHCCDADQFTLPDEDDQVGVRVFDDTTLSDNVKQAQYIGADPGTITLPRRPKDGQTVQIVAASNIVTVQGGCFALCTPGVGPTPPPAMTVAKCGIAFFTFVACKKTWSSLGAAIPNS